MRLHGNARTCPHSRRLLVERVAERGWAVAAEAAGVSVRTASKWVARFRAEGEPGLVDRSSRPRVSPSETPAERVEAIVILRRLRCTAAEISQALHMPLSTVSVVLRRVGWASSVALTLQSRPTATSGENQASSFTSHIPDAW